MVERLVIVGAGGLGREVLDFVSELDPSTVPEVAGYLDDHAVAAADTRLAAPLLGRIDDYEPQPTDRFLVAVGDPTSRADVVRRLSGRGAWFFSLVHPLARVARTAEVGEGALVAPFSTISNDARVEPHALVLPYALVGHDSSVGRWSVLSPHAVVNGESVLEDGVFLGSMACVNPRVKIGSWSKLAAGCIVYDDVPPGSLVEGNPAVAHPMQYHLAHV